LYSRENFKNGQREGLYETFQYNGQLLTKGKHKNGKKHGLWEYFDEEGNLTKSETWEKEKLVE
jgi:antitoxin component YwqK of YwqJK toxin-antitoxin module